MWRDSTYPEHTPKRANELTLLADAAGDPDQQLQASHANWGAAFYSGDLKGCKRYALAGFERYESDRHYPVMLRFGGHDVGCCARFHLAQSECLLGFPDTAVKASAAASELARDLDHLWSQCIALHVESIIRQIIGDVDAVKRANAEFGSVADRHGIARFAAIAPIIEGWIGVCQNEGRSAIDKMKHGLVALEKTGGLLRLSYYWGLIADAHRRVGEIDAALNAVDHGLSFAETRGEAWYLSELHRLKGAMLLKESAADEGVQHLETALAIAREKSAKWFELRTATSLARHRTECGDQQVAQELLEPIYSWFTEGFDTVDLKTARVLLDELS